ncbi:hypothetical protein [Streptomyces triculaminicus]|uniref:hypothetical protein n=1 Tax=Streptomyces triculaminicus TaxID=2816232 RepID=UPI00378DB2B8
MTLEPEGRRTLSFWESFGAHLELGAGMFLLSGVPSLLIVVVAGMVRLKKGYQEFRALMMLLLLPPLWPVWFVDTAMPFTLWVEIAVQILFAAFVMPVPLLPDPYSEDREETEQLTPAD